METQTNQNPLGLEEEGLEDESIEDDQSNDGDQIEEEMDESDA